ncbi:MAG: peptidylprolyl isomerase [Acidobacteria bacterium]|nr:peptidylprolyl isomerase [Acidobacteriota bacterium]
MLNLMRRKKRLRLILWLVIAALALSMLIFFVPGTNMGGFFDTPGVVASVEGRNVTAQDFSRLYRRVANNFRAANNIDEETIRAMGLPTQVLNELINYEVMEVLAKRFGITLTEEELFRALENNPNLQVNGKFIGVENYKALLAQNGYTAAQFESELRRMKLHDKVRDFVTSAIRVTDRELRDEYQVSTQKIQVDYVLLKKDEFKKRVKPSAEDIEAWFNDHKDSYTIREKRNAEYLLIPYMQFVSQVEITEDDILREWSSVPHEEMVEAAHILLLVNDASEDAEVKEKAEEVLKLAQSGQDFAELARKYSDDSGSAEQGGYLGTFTRGQMVPEFESAAFALESGELSGLVRSQYGYHIILSLRHENPTLESSREQLFAIASDRKLRELLLEKAEEAGAAAAKRADLNEVVKNLDFSVEVRETGLLQKDEPLIDLGLSPEMIDDVFSMREIGEIGKPVEHAMGFAVPRLLQVELPRPGTIDEFRQQAEADYVDAKAKELMDAEAQKLSAEGIRQANLTAAAKAQGLSVKTSQEFTRNGTPDSEIGSNSSFNQAVFALETGAVSSPQSVLDNVVVFQVKSRSPFDEAAFEKQKPALRTQLLENRQDRYFEEYVNRAREEMSKSGKITISRTALDQATLYF